MADRSGFEEFVAVHATVLLRSARLLAANSADADDLLQETLTRLWIKWPRVSRAERPLAYARTTMARLHIDSRRLRRSHEIPIDIGLDDGPSAADPDPHLELWRALGRLQPLDRAILVLRYHDGYPSGDVAAMLGLSDGAVRKRAGRALESMRAVLDPTEGTSDASLR